MRILIVAATGTEIAPLVETWRALSSPHPRLKRYEGVGHEVDVLTTGVGMVATAAWCSRAIGETSYELALNLGVCGSFDPVLSSPTAVHVVSDCFSEMGAEDGERFLTLQELKLLGDDEFPFTGGRLVNAAPPANEALSGLPAVDGITVNTVHGRDQSIDEVRRRFQPAVESMEGAAFMYVCLLHGIRFAQVRTVSNAVERRNRGAWNLPGAIDALTATARRILELA
jgi:futalosine hydrolase